VVLQRERFKRREETSKKNTSSLYLALKPRILEPLHFGGSPAGCGEVRDAARNRKGGPTSKRKCFTAFFHQNCQKSPRKDGTVPVHHAPLRKRKVYPGGEGEKDAFPGFHALSRDLTGGRRKEKT